MASAMVAWPDGARTHGARMHVAGASDGAHGISHGGMARRGAHHKPQQGRIWLMSTPLRLMPCALLRVPCDVARAALLLLPTPPRLMPCAPLLVPATRVRRPSCYITTADAVRPVAGSCACQPRVSLPRLVLRAPSPLPCQPRSVKCFSISHAPASPTPVHLVVTIVPGLKRLVRAMLC